MQLKMNDVWPAHLFRNESNVSRLGKKTGALLHCQWNMTDSKPENTMNNHFHNETKQTKKKFIRKIQGFTNISTIFSHECTFMHTFAWGAWLTFHIHGWMYFLLAGAHSSLHYQVYHLFGTIFKSTIYSYWLNILNIELISIGINGISSRIHNKNAKIFFNYVKLVYIFSLQNFVPNAHKYKFLF